MQLQDEQELLVILLLGEDAEEARPMGQTRTASSLCANYALSLLVAAAAASAALTGGGLIDRIF